MATYIHFLGSKLDVTSELLTTTKHIAVTFKSGKKPRFFFDGAFIGEGDVTVSPDNEDATGLTIGNSNELGAAFPGKIKQVYLGDKPLTDLEILALYEQAQQINGEPMETGNRVSERFPTSGTTTSAIDHEFDPGGPFQLVDIKMVLNTAAATSENMVIDWTDGDDTVEEYSENLSVTAKTENVWRFDKRYSDGSKINVSYTNTDARQIYLIATWQIDESVV